MTATLTDRYVYATLRRLPAQQRPDVERELRASIADAVDSAVAAGADPAEAERAVLTQLGDPARLADGYNDRPLQLIGPALFLDYTRLLKVLLAVIVPAAAVGIAIARVVQGAGVGEVIGSVVGIVVNTTVHIGFWTTLIFAIVERTPNLRWAPVRSWTLDDLPELQPRRSGIGELVASTVWTGVVLTFLLLIPRLPFRTDSAGDAISLLSPELWDNGVVYVFAGLVVLGLVLEYVRHYARFSAVLAILGGVVGVASGALIIWVGSADRLLNPEFTAVMGWPADVTKWVHIGLQISGALAIVVSCIQTVVSLVTRSWVAGDLGALIRDAVRGLPGPSRR